MIRIDLIFKLIILIYFRGIWVFCLKRKHLLVVLLSLEYIVLILYFMLGVELRIFNYGFYIIIVFLVFVVCEGALRLGIVVSMMRSYGNDFFQSFSVLRC